MKAMGKPETIIFLWFVAFATILFILTIEFQNYNINIKATIAALLTIPFAIWALHSIIQMNQLQTEEHLFLKSDNENIKTAYNNYILQVQKAIKEPSSIKRQ
jgi:hypothetical protein